MRSAGSSRCESCGAPVRQAANYCAKCGAPTITPAKPSFELRAATILFADLKGSTEIVAALDPEAATLRVKPIIHEMTQIVRASGGALVEIRGDGILAMFTDDEAEGEHAFAGARAALEIQRRFRRLPDAPPVRIGVHTGEVVVSHERGAVQLSGSSVYLAARLEQAAEPNTVLVSDDTYRSARPWISGRARGRMRFKGFESPCEVWELRDARNHSRWRARAALGLSPLAGRDRLLAEIRGAIAAAGASHGGVVCLSGAAGAGKSRLLHEGLAPSTCEGVVVWTADCEPAARRSPYFVVRQLFRSWLGVGEEESTGEFERKSTDATGAEGLRLEGHAQALRALLGQPNDLVWSGLDAHARKRRIADAFIAVCKSQAVEAPLILSVDDLHWCDEESLQLLSALADVAGSMRIVLIVAARSPDKRDVLHRVARGRPIEVAPLSPHEARSLAEALLGGDAAIESLKQSVLETAQGLPLYIEEIVRDAFARGILAGEVGAARLSTQVERMATPPSIRAILTGRIGRLDAVARRVVIAASVIGRRFPSALLARIVDLPGSAFKRALAELKRDEFLVQFDQDTTAYCEFQHDFLVEAAYGAALRGERRELHAATVKAAELFYQNRIGDWVGFLSHHAELAELHEEGLRYSRLAAEQAVQISAYRAALDYCERALRHVEQLPRTRENRQVAIDLRLLLRVAVGGTADLRTWLRHLDTAVEEADAIGDVSRRLLALIHRTWALNFAGAAPDAIRSGASALTLALATAAPPSETLARFILAQARYAAGQFREAIDVLDPAISWLADGREAQRIGTTGTTMCVGLMLRANAHSSLGEFDRAVADLERLKRLATRTGIGYDLVAVAYCDGQLLSYSGDVEKALTILQSGYDLCRRAEANVFIPLLAALLGNCMLRAGRPAEADSLLTSAIEAAELSGHVVSKTAAVGGLAAVHLAEGRAEDGLRLAGEAKSAAAQFGHRAVEISATHVLAQCIAALEPRELARPIFLLRSAIENATDIGAAPAALACCETARSILLAHGRRAEAVDLCRRAVAMAEQARWPQATARFLALMDEAGDFPSRIASG